MGATPAHAQSAAISISIPAQPLSQALLELANRYSLDLAYSPEIVKGLYAPALSGSLTADQALGQLLANTNIRYQRRGKSVSLTALAPNADSQVPQLAPLTVVGSSNGLTPTYAGGQIATGSRVGMLGNKDFMETPFSTKAYTREAIESTQSGNLLRVISDSDPSVSTTGSDYDLSNYASVHIRGFNTAGLEDLGINGLYGLASYGNRSLGDFSERVEIFKGPSALLNGMMPSGSVAGTVNTVTKRASDEDLNRVGIGYESDSIYSGKVDFGRRFGADNQWGVRINATKRKGETAVKDKKLDNEAIGLGLDYRSPNLRVGFDWIHNEENTDGVSAQITSRLASVPAPPTHDKLIAGEPWSVYNTRGDLFMLKGEYDLSDDTTIWASVGRNDRKMTANVMNWRLLNTDGDFARDSVLVWNSKFENIAADIGGQTKFVTGPIKHQLSFNANASERTVYQARANYLVAGLPSGNIYDPTYVSKPNVNYSPDIPKSNENTLQSLGVADTLSMLDDRLQLTVGVRQQRVKQKTFDPVTGQVNSGMYDERATTPAFAALFKLTDQVSIYGNYIEGLSAGAQAPATAANAGDMFAPYKSKQKEIGLKFDAGSLATTVALFEITRPSAITNADNVYSFDGEQRNRGIEWEVFGEPVKGLRLIGGLSWKQAKLTQTQGGLYDGYDAPEVPRFEAKLGVAYDVPQINGLTLTANAIHTGKQYLDQANSQSIPSWRRYDLGFAYATKIASTPVTFRGTVYNVANSHYWYGALWRGVSQPRTFNLSASFEF
ncbi:ferric-mycobactin receptor FemA [Alcaligenes pakistanensis]|uniref:Ferric-mycobactin receptor FemA n=1 Tax=Alcaligenes pakistanensis TaxID=1482717 RepID=A0A8H9M850_9BURK|nr:TonB-dependent receptor [Alcaligenes pakistanensis]GHC51253.1 ferric-mycobactin receptor FemA [Alcaligenes pakistanensis]